MPRRKNPAPELSKSLRARSKQLPEGSLHHALTLGIAMGLEKGGPRPSAKFEPCPPRGQRPRCGARKKSDGQPCQAPVYRKGPGRLSNRCRMHGGASTGPKTAEGKARVLEGQRKGLERRRALLSAQAEASKKKDHT